MLIREPIQSLRSLGPTEIRWRAKQKVDYHPRRPAEQKLLVQFFFFLMEPRNVLSKVIKALGYKVGGRSGSLVLKCHKLAKALNRLVVFPGSVSDLHPGS